MSEEKVIAEETAPALPTSEPPIEDPKPETAEISAENVEENKEGENKTEEKTEEKKPSRLKKRLTLKWGKNRDQAETPKEPEAPADPRADVIAWIAQQIPVAVHKVNHTVLEWAQKIAVEDESARQTLPGKDAQVTRNQFLAFLRDGDILVKLANKLQPGAIEPTVAEEGADAAKQKEVQTKNIEAFSTWAKETLGAEEGKSMTAGDLLEKGKTGYSAVFDTLWNLGLKAQEKFEKDGLDVDAIVNTVSSTVRTTILGQIVAFFRRNRRPATEEKTEEKPVEEINAAENQQVEETIEKTEVAPESTPAVAAN